MMPAPLREEFASVECRSSFAATSRAGPVARLRAATGDGPRDERPTGPPARGKALREIENEGPTDSRSRPERCTSIVPPWKTSVKKRERNDSRGSVVGEGDRLPDEPVEIVTIVPVRQTVFRDPSSPPCGRGSPPAGVDYACRTSHRPRSGDDAVQTVWTYLAFYRDAVYFWWDNISPAEYGIALIAIGVFGYWLMGSSIKRI
jgi:hypothetical protein